MMTKEDAFEFLNRTAQGIADMFGPACETLVQDMGRPDHPILSIYNGEVSGRTVGSTRDILGSDKLLSGSDLTKDFVNMYADTPDGRRVKSSTFHLMGDDYNLALGIDFDYTSLTYANRTLAGLTDSRTDLQSALRGGGDSALESIFDECCKAVGKAPELMTKQDRLDVVAQMDRRGAFSMRRGVAFTAKKLQVSRYTVYKYIDELAVEKEQKKGKA